MKYISGGDHFRKPKTVFFRQHHVENQRMEEEKEGGGGVVGEGVRDAVSFTLQVK